MTDINQGLSEQLSYSLSNTVLYFSTLVDKTISQAEQIQKLEDRLRRFELLFEGLQGVENVTSSLQILDERLGSVEEELSRTSDKINDLECKVDDLESVDVEDHIRDIMRVATLTIDI